MPELVYYIYFTYLGREGLYDIVEIFAETHTLLLSVLHFLNTCKDMFIWSLLLLPFLLLFAHLINGSESNLDKHNNI